MTPLKDLPRELWETILRYAISVPVFFETDPIQVQDLETMVTLYKDPGPYYAAERTRNTLRRVSSSWNEYLTLFSFRYVELRDVLIGNIPSNAIHSAVRLRMLCDDEEDDIIEFDEDHPKILIQAIQSKEGPLSLEILEDETLYWHYLTPLQEKLPWVKTVITDAQNMIPEANKLFPKAVFIGGSTRKSVTKYSNVPLSSPHITTLSIRIRKFERCQQWVLPSLRYLSFTSFYLTVGRYIDLLQTIGKELRILFDTSPFTRSFTLPTEIWTLCPNLERFQTSFAWPSHHQIPSSLQSIRINLYYLKGGWSDYEDIVPIESLQTAGISTITLTDSWMVLPKYPCFGDFISVMLNKFTIHDIFGRSFQEFVILLILKYWKKERVADPFIEWKRRKDLGYVQF